MDRRIWQATVPGVKKESDTTEATEHAHTHKYMGFQMSFFCNRVEMSQNHRMLESEECYH